MGFIASVISAIVDVIVYIVEAVVQIVEMVVQLIMVLLGYGGSTQIVEYFEVRNYPLFEDVDRKNPTTQALLQAILQNKDLSTSLIYNLVFRSMKGNIKEFMAFIENGNYFEGFPELDSYIVIVDYDELTAALQTLNGVPCTPGVSALRALTKQDWVKYWLQENKGYDVGANLLGTEYREVTTGPFTPAADTHNVTLSPGNIQLDITSAVAPSDDVLADTRWLINLSTIVYNVPTDDYTIEAYNAAGVTITLPYNAPSRPTELHYVAEYFRNVDPGRTYLFVYKVGEGTYVDLDTVEEPINIDNSVIQAMPAIPLRISNSNYTTFGATKQAAIEDLLGIIHLDPDEIITGVMADAGLAPGDIDNVYVNFGVRMWDTSQAGMSYLFRMFENLYPAQGSTQGIYNNTQPGEVPPTNNILTRTEDKEDAFQWNYISYAFTSLVDINANSGSTENGIYYSDMSKFDANNILATPYYSSSGKGTYNVGYKADNLTEVADFLTGNGVTNPGTTTSEATNWLQVTERMSYNNPTPVLQESDGSTATLIYLTPDAVYENNGSGVLKLVQQASEETTSGQSITYYKIKPSGLAAYTVAAPIGAMRVIDGDTGVFKTVKFNLGAKEDLMVPFVYTFVKGLSNTDQAQLFLAGAHLSIYVAHYEVIHHAGMDFLTALVMLILLVVIIYYTITTFDPTALKAWLATVAGAAATSGLLAAAQIVLSKLAVYAFKWVVMAIIQQIIVEVAGDTELGMILQLLATVAFMSWEGSITYGQAPPDFVGPMPANAPSSIHFNSMTSFKSPASFTPLQWAGLAVQAFSGMSSLKAIAIAEGLEELSARKSAWDIERAKKLTEIEKLTEIDYGMDQYGVAGATQMSWRKQSGIPMYAEWTIAGGIGIVPMTLASIAITPDFDFYGATYDV
tara:strand:+ start:1728 stop:4457 length:2730 start_codon:yes stop_codon:yes gene_type:complete